MSDEKKQMSDEKDKKVTVSLTFDEVLLADIDRLAKESDMSRSQYFRALARNAVKPAMPKQMEAQAA